MCDVNPEHILNVCYENGKKVLYLRILKALHGCIEYALLWYELFANTLQDMGFEINPYDKCVANKMINGKQCTICWYVDDNKVSHVDPAANTMIIDAISEHFGELVVTRRKKHTFLGMDLEMLDESRFAIGMKSYLEEAIKLFGEDVSKKVSSIATKKFTNGRP